MARKTLQQWKDENADLQDRLREVDYKLEQAVSDINMANSKLKESNRQVDSLESEIQETHALLDAFHIDRAYESYNSFDRMMRHSNKSKPYRLAARWMLYVKQEAERAAKEATYLKVESDGSALDN